MTSFTSLSGSRKPLRLKRSHLGVLLRVVLSATALGAPLLSGTAQAGTVIASDSRLPNGSTGNASSYGSASSGSGCISADGTKVTFYSSASDLVPGDTDGVDDVFVRDLTAGTTTRISVDSNGGQGNGSSRYPSLSADGTKVAFSSSATNLVSGDTNGASDIFVRDLTTGTLTRVSLDSSSNQGNNDSILSSLSADGTKVAFESSASNLVPSDTNGTYDVFVRDLTKGTTSCVSVTPRGVPGNRLSLSPSISADGTKVAYQSTSSNMVAGDTNGASDIFVRDLTTKNTTRVSVDSSGAQSSGVQSSADSSYPSISADGTKVAFSSSAINLVFGDNNQSSDVFVRDLTAGTTTRVSVDSNGNQGMYSSVGASLSADGTKVAFSSASNFAINDFNGVEDVFVHDLNTGATSRVSVDSSGNLANGASIASCLNADGTKVVFQSSASNFVSNDTNRYPDLFVHDTATGVTQLVTPSIIPLGTIITQPSNGASSMAHFSTSADGTKVAFASLANNLVQGDTNLVQDIFVRDLTTGLTTRVSVDSSGVQANNDCYSPAISADGTKVAFTSLSANLTVYDPSHISNVFVHDLNTGTTVLASVSSSGAFGNLNSFNPVLSGDGTKVAFNSLASTLVSGDTGGFIDIFVRDLTAGTTTRVSLDSNGNQGNGDSQLPSLSADGTKIAFQSAATNLVGGDTNAQNDVFVRDLTTGITTLASLSSSGVQGNNPSSFASLSADGTKVAFASAASNLTSYDANGFSDIFVRNLSTGLTTCASVDSIGSTGNGNSYSPSLSANGSRVTFYSQASTLVGGDTNGFNDIFVRDLTAHTTTRVNVDGSGNQGDGPSVNPSINGDGTQVAYYSTATNLVPGDTNGTSDVFVSDVITSALSINDVTKAEGSSGTTSFSFTVSLSAKSVADTTVNYAIANTTTDSADFGTPFDSDGGTPGTLTIPAGSTTGTITVPVNGDRVVESDETFTVNLNGASGATLSDAQAIGAITNDDHAPTAISLSRQQIAEHSGVNAVVATISATDADSGESFTYTLPANTDDNSAFAISGNQLRTAQNFDTATKSNYTITLSVSDLGGNTFQKQFTITVLDATKPTVTITSPTLGQKVLLANFTGNIISGTATDNVGVAGVKVRLSRKRGTTNTYWNGTGFVTTSIYLNATVTTAGNPSVTWTLNGQLPPAAQLDNGTYDLQVLANDAAGNKSDYATTSFTLSGDLVAPTLAITTPTANQKVLFSNLNGNTISGTASDDTAVTGVKVRLSRKRGTTNTYWNGNAFVTSSSLVDATYNNGQWNLGANTPPISQLDVGTYTVEAYALDAAGNRSAVAKVTFSLANDSTAPSVSINTPTQNQLVPINSFTAGAISGTASDDTAVTTVKLKLQRKRGTLTTYWNGTDFTPTVTLVNATYSAGNWSYNTPIPASKLDQGGYTLYATAYDAAGNFKTSPSRLFTVTGTVAAPDAATTDAQSSAGRS